MSLIRDLEITNESRNLSAVRRAVSEVLDQTAFDREQRNKIILAVDEALANIVEHAYQGGTGLIRIQLTLDDEHFSVQIRDNGVRFDPGSRLKAEIDIHEHIRLGLTGGLGLFLMRRIMDEIDFAHDGEDFVNQLRLVKKLPGQAPAESLGGVE